MTPSDFRALASPKGFALPLQALWHDAHGDWDVAHTLAQEAASPAGDWVHAYLHRKEGDEGNARYWYRRAGKTLPGTPLSTEWDEIAQNLLETFSV